MGQFIIQLGTMIFQASILILVILVLRFLLARMKLPKRYGMLLWLLPFLSLICPWRIVIPQGLWKTVPAEAETDTLPVLTESKYPEEQSGLQHWLLGGGSSAASTIASEGAIRTDPDKGEEAQYLAEKAAENEKNAENLPDTWEENAGKTANTNSMLWKLLFVLWFVGFLGIAGYSLISYYRIKRKLAESVSGNGGYYIADRIEVPVVFGLWKPQIFIPSGIEEGVLPYVLAHEETHIARKDSQTKLLAFAITGLHWFNPLVWLTFHYMGKDMEMACDEETIRRLGQEQKQSYASALLKFSGSRRIWLAAPPAFGEGDIWERIRNIVQGEKRVTGQAAAALAAAVLLGVFFMTARSGPSDQNEADTQTAASETEIKENGTGADDYLAQYNDLSEMEVAVKAYWEERLTVSGEIGDGSPLYSLGCYNADEDTLKNGSQELDFYLYTMEEDQIPVMYKTHTGCLISRDGIFVEEWQDQEFDQVTDAETAKKMECMLFLWHYGLEGTREPEETLAVNISLSLFERYAADSSMNPLREVLSPETALPYLMHYTGGRGEIFMETADGDIIVSYTFEDGSSIYYEMISGYRISDGTDTGLDFWFPYYRLSEEKVEELKDTMAVLEEASQKAEWIKEKKAAEIAAAGLDGENVWAGFYTGALLKDLKTDGDIEIEEAVVPLSRAPGQDVWLYSVVNGRGMMIVDGNEVYTLLLDWAIPRLHIPAIHKADYDGDGENEYAMDILIGAGTGVNQEILAVLEERDGRLEFCSFRLEDLIEQLNRMEYVYDEENMIASLDTGYAAYELNLAPYFALFDDCSFEALSWGDILYVENRDGQWYLTGFIGIKSAENVTVDYYGNTQFAAPIYYEETQAGGSFTLGDILIENYYENSAAD